MRSASSGTSEAKSRASTTSMGFGTRFSLWGRGGLARDRRRLALGRHGPAARRSGLAFDHDVAEELGLLRADLALPAQLEHAPAGSPPLRALALAARHGAEQQRPRVAQQREDLGHPLQHRGRVGLDLPRPLPLLLLDQPLERPLQPVDARGPPAARLRAAAACSTGGPRSAPARPRARPATRPCVFTRAYSRSRSSSSCLSASAFVVELLLGRLVGRAPAAWT